MKRSSDSYTPPSTPPKSKRSRSRRGRSPSRPSPRRYVSPHRDEYARPTERSYPYKKIRYSYYNAIRITHNVEKRVAKVCFRRYEDARDAKHAKPRIIISDKVAIVEAVYEVPRAADPYRNRPCSITPEFDRYHYARSPQRRISIERYARGYGPPPGAPMHRDYRRDVMPVPHHEYMPRPRMHHGPPHVPPTEPLMVMVHQGNMLQHF